MKLLREYVNAIKNWKHWDGRSRRRDYWMFTLVNFIVLCVLGALMFVWTDVFEFHVVTIFAFGLYFLLSIVPFAAVAIRRMHDVDKSGYYALLVLIPIVGWVWFNILVATVGDYGKNQYGEDPKAEFFQTGIDK